MNTQIVEATIDNLFRAYNEKLQPLEIDKLEEVVTHIKTIKEHLF